LAPHFRSAGVHQLEPAGSRGVLIEEGKAVSITPAECKAARKLLGWSQDYVATKLLVGKQAIRKFESRERLPWTLGLDGLQRLFEAAGVEFNNNGDGPGVKLKAKAR
jgi:ribosome-binding protein aMBF1 (putative translation factor)